jgi:polysaccharide transporter, PST family
MFKKRTSDNRLILKNLSYLSFLRLINIGVKFLLVAYLIRILGEINYGILTWSEAIIQFLIIFVNFGFNIYAARYIVENREDKERINEITSSVLIIKLGLLILSFAILFVFSFFKPFFDHRSVLLLMLFMGFGEVLFPIWYFQGIEKLKEAMYITVFSKLILLGGTFIFIKAPEDIMLFVFLLVISNIFMGVAGYVTLVKNYQFKPVFVKIKVLIVYLKDAYMFFLGIFLSMTFNFATIFLIGIYFSMEYVAGFDVALKIVLVAIIPFDILQQAVYPTVTRNKDKRLIRSLIAISLLAGIGLMILLYYFSQSLLGIFGGIEMIKYREILQALSLMVPFSALTFILGSCTLLAFGYTKEFNYSLIISSILYIVIVIILMLTNYLTFWNLVYLRIFSDIILVSIRVYYVYQRKILVRQ